MHIAEDFVDTGNRVLVMVTFRGHGRGSGMEAELPEFHIWTVRGGAIVRFQWFYRRDDALAAACADG
jgi:ketosteroid isomerase-like protein